MRPLELETATRPRLLYASAPGVRYGHSVIRWRFILSWADAHSNLPNRARWIAKADVAPREQPSGQRRPSFYTEGFLFSASAISATTIQAYRETHYHVQDDPAYTLQVGQRGEELLAAHKRRKALCSAFLTACNPYSQLLPAEENAKRQHALARELNLRSLTFVDGLGKHPSGAWPGEASFLVFDLTLESAKTLGKALEQNAILWSGVDAVPQLILLR